MSDFRASLRAGARGLLLLADFRAPLPITHMDTGYGTVIKDPRINASAGCMVAYAAWVIGAALLLATWIDDDRRLAVTSIFFVGIAATATVRTYVVALGEAVRNAFVAGRESVTPMRRT